MRGIKIPLHDLALKMQGGGGICGALRYYLHSAGQAHDHDTELMTLTYFLPFCASYIDGLP